MKKQDLKTGMVVETEDGSRYMVAYDIDDKKILVSENGWLDLQDYDDFWKTEVDALNIIKIYSRPSINRETLLLNAVSRTLLWERPNDLSYIKLKSNHGYVRKSLHDGELYLGNHMERSTSQCMFSEEEISEIMENIHTMFITEKVEK